MQKNDQIKRKSRGNKKSKQKIIHQKREKNTLYNIEMVYKAKNNSMKFFDDYSSIVSDKKHEATKGTGLKMLTPKQMLQRLPIAKTGNDAKNY